LNKCIKKPEGFTLIEVVIGLVILAIGLLAIAALQTNSTKGDYY